MGWEQGFPGLVCCLRRVLKHCVLPSALFYYYYFFFVRPGIKLRALHNLGEGASPDLHPKLICSVLLILSVIIIIITV